MNMNDKMNEWRRKWLHFNEIIFSKFQLIPSSGSLLFTAAASQQKLRKRPTIMLKFVNSSRLLNATCCCPKTNCKFLLVNKQTFLKFTTKVKLISGIFVATTYIFTIVSIGLKFWYLVYRQANVANSNLSIGSHCVKSVCVWRHSGPYFSAFGLHTENVNVNAVKVS